MNLEKMRTLENGWDSYKADPPSPESIERARAFLELKPEPNRCVPTAMGGVALTYRKGRRSAFIEFYNKGVKIAVLLSDGVAMNVVQSETPQPIVDAVNAYLAEIPVLTREEIDASEDLDMLVAKHVFDFPGLGYYRRKSAYDNTEPCFERCNKGDETPDMPGWKASAYYLHNNWQRTVNLFSSDFNEAFRVVQAMLWAAPKYTDRFILHMAPDKGIVYGATDVISYTTSILKNLDPKKICLAALYAIADVSPTDRTGD